MAARKRSGGRTTPKGTTNQTRSGRAKPSRAAPPKADRRSPEAKKLDRKPTFVSRPDSHNRGNR